MHATDAGQFTNPIIPKTLGEMIDNALKHEEMLRRQVDEKLSEYDRGFLDGIEYQKKVSK